MEGLVERSRWESSKGLYTSRLCYIQCENDLQYQPIGGYFLQTPTVGRVLRDGHIMDFSVKIKSCCVTSDTNTNYWKRIH